MLDLIQNKQAKNLIDELIAVTGNEGEVWLEDFFYGWYNDSEGCYNESDRFFEDIDLEMVEEAEREMDLLLPEDHFNAMFWGQHKDIDKSDKPLVSLCYSVFLDNSVRENLITNNQRSNFCLDNY